MGVIFKNSFWREHSLYSDRLSVLPDRKSLVLEPLEPRLLLSASLVGIPDWSFQGPAPIVSDANEINVIAAPGNAAGGAIESVVIRPIPSTTLFQIYAATVNGGVWRSDNADPANPGDITWTPLTDQQQSLAMGSIAVSPLDATGNTLFVSTGSFSNLGTAGGPAVGILRTTDGGVTWNTFVLTAAAGEPKAQTILPTGIDLDAGTGVQEMILVGTLGGGMFRSDDNGETYTPISGLNGLPNGNVTQLVADPNNPNQFYAAIAGQGVFQGLFNGTIINWTAVDTAGLTNAGTSGDIQLAVHDDGANTVLFALVVGSAPGNQGAFRSVNGGNWTALAQPPAIFANPNDGSFFPGPGQSGFFITADPTDPQVAYITGYSSGNHVFRYDPSGAGSWVAIMAGGGGPTRPHPDGRGLFFLNNTTLVEVNDGGIYFLPNPITATAATANWQSFNGNTSNETGLGAVEMHNIAWDSLSDVILAGSQDNGTEVQEETGDLVWTVIHGGDGGDVLVDNFTLAGANQSIRYFSSQNLGNFSRQVFDSNNNPVGGKVGLNTGGLAGFVPQFVNPIEINAIAPPAGQSTRVVIGGGTNPAAMPAITVGAVYELTDAGTAAVPTWTQVTLGAGANGSVTAFAYGGRLNGVDNPDVLYIGIGGAVFVRTTAGGTANATATPFPGASVQDITLDPNDWRHAFVASSGGVWETTDAGANWVNRSGNLSSVTSNIQTIEFAEQGGVDAVLVGGLGGVFRMLTNNPGVWSEFGAGLPNTVAFDLEYNVTDDILVVGAFGRGAWTIEDASDFLTVNGALQIFGDEDFFGQDDTIRLVIDEANPSLLDVFINDELSQFQLSVIQQLQINVFSLGGEDTLIVDSSFGLINVAGGIRYNGGDGSDALRLEQTDGPIRMSDTYSVGPAIGSGVSTIVGGGTAGTQVVSFEDLEPVVDLVPVDELIVNGTPTGNAINYSGGTLVTRGLVSIDDHETIEFSNKGELIIDGAGGDTINVYNDKTPTSLTSITINGGNPDSGDTLNITGVGSATAVTVNTATSTITGATGASGAVSVVYSGIENLLYDGQGDNDVLTVVGTAANDVIVHNPGANDQAGSFSVNALLPLSYQNLGSSGSLMVDGAGGANTLIYNGTASNDSFTIGVAGQINLNSRLVVNTAGIQTLTLNGFAGDDTFTLVPAISATDYTTINLNGGDQASAGGDRVFLIGTILADDIEISGQTVELGGKTIKGSGIEDIRLDALDGDDRITYTGVDGVTENITVSSSGGTGGGQISIPGVALVNFAGVERISVDGSTPTPTETDTLTFAGTNAADTFNINLAAAGTSVDPVLRLVTGGTQRIMLENYTNFETLRVLGLDGQDIFNVNTSPGTSRNLFVDGGLPSGKKKSTDNLNIFYTMPRPSIIHSAATQDPDAGIVDLDYGTARFVVQYDEIEKVVIRKA